jgi:small ligand-binding sensory domain FIST
MKWTSALSTRPSLEAALNEAIANAQVSLGQPADLAFVFISNTFASEYPRVMPLLREKFGNIPIFGCGGGGVIGQDHRGIPLEREGDPALSITLAVLPDVRIQPFYLRADQLPDLDSSPDRWVDVLGVDPAQNPQFILFADSMSARINDLLQGLDYAYPQSVKIGGLTAGISSFSGSGLFGGDRLYREGTVGVALSGNIAVETIVSQGCRPVGQVLRVAEADKHVLLQLEAQSEGEVGENSSVNTKVKTALESLHHALETLDENDRARAQHSLSIGIVRDAFKSNLEAGDFLIRNLIGVDPRIGAIAMGDRIRPGQRVQFHLRDAQTSAKDLEDLLIQYRNSTRNQPPPAGALFFNCLGRGEHFYGRPNFDTQLFQQYLATTPIGGFFCHGEIGPIGGTTFLHGYTAAFALFRPLTRTDSCPD